MFKDKIIAGIGAALLALGIVTIATPAAPASALQVGSCVTGQLRISGQTAGEFRACRDSTYGFTLSSRDTLTDGKCVYIYVAGGLDGRLARACTGRWVSQPFDDSAYRLFNQGLGMARDLGNHGPPQFLTLGAYQGCGGRFCAQNIYYIP